MQDQAGPFAGCPPRSRSVAEMDGCSRQNPAYRLATGRALETGPFLFAHSPYLCHRRIRLGRSAGAEKSLARSPRLCEHVFDMVVCVLLPRFALTVAAGGRAELARGPVALAPEPGREPLIGEASAAAEAHGVRAGLRLGEALARCPTLKLVAPDPAGVADRWDRVLASLEEIGAAVESERPGVACFDASGLLNLHGGLDGVLAVTRRALGAPARLGVASSRFAAVAAASRARPRRAEVVPRAMPRYLAPLPIALLGTRAETAALPEPLERFGIRTLGELAALPRDALADRFGAAGPLARDLARGRDTPLVPRRAAERLEEALELPESGSGTQLEHALGLLIDRLVARRERRGRTFRAVVLSASLVEGGTWRLRMTFREAHADPRRMRIVLGSRLG